MGFKALTKNADNGILKQEYKNGYCIGVIRLSDNYFFFRRGFTRYYISYGDIQRCFRRVMLLPYGKKKKRENIEVEYAVIMNEGKELAQIQLPGAKAAEELLAMIHEKAPDAQLVCPRKKGKDKIR